MTTQTHSLPSTANVTLPPAATRKLEKTLLAGGIILLLITIALAFINKDFTKQFAHSWLFAFYFFFTLTLGGIFWVILQHTTNAGWSIVVRRQMENIGANIPLIALLALPLIPVLPYLYKWMDPQYTAGDPIYAHKQGFLNIPFFTIRALFYFGTLIYLIHLLRRHSIAQDHDGYPTHTLRLQKISFIALPLFAVITTFSAIDWLMALDFHWYSTMWGVYIFAGSALSSLAFLIILTFTLQRLGYLNDVINKEHYHLMGKLLLAFTVFWAYIAFSQYMLIWYSNIPEETTFYIQRNQGSWYWLSLLLVIGHFIIPFLLLLFQITKRKPHILASIAAWLLLMHAADHYWIILPRKHPQGIFLHIMDLTAWLGMAALFTAFLIRNARNSALIPLRDPRLQESLHVSN
ncbi:MAG: hypothetical protein NZM04_04320 [Methylacidiphilales bacterium]|nr:hypothetical protein [Candidatus Methylacidiphilales bacterium]MDW8349687.1 hypothetical protein [Verrucomicrobiae bacterium]